MTKTRPQCSLILENAKGEVLLQLRDNKPDIHYPNCLGTFGGEIESGETPGQAAEREIKEELGYTLKDYDYIGNFPHNGYDVHVFRKVDLKLNIKQLALREGQCMVLVSKENLEKQKYGFAFNCKEILIHYFKEYH